MRFQQKHLLFCISFLLLYPLVFPSSLFAASLTLTPVPTYKNVDYTLPYPGLLPDNPLYPLKAFRDKVISMFISDPLKKAKFDLLQADKRMNASLYLFNQRHDKEDIIISTLSKGENYFEDGIGQVRQAKVQGEDDHDTIRLFSKASQKHIEVLRMMESKTTGTFRKNLRDEETRVLGFERTVDTIGQ